MNRAQFPYDYIPDKSVGRPLFNAELYLGIPDLDPEIPANQIDVYGQQEDGTTVLLPQPIETGAGGVPMYQGSPVSLLIDEYFYSFKAIGRNGAQVYYNENVAAYLTATSLASIVTPVETIADLRNVNPTVNGQQYSVREFSTGADRGGGIFYYDSTDISTADDGGTFIVTGGGKRLKRVIDGFLHTDMYGIFEENTDNLPALQKAANTAASLFVPLYGEQVKKKGVSGRFIVPDNFVGHYIRLKQLNPVSDIRTIFKNSGSGNVKLYNCCVDRNGTADAADPQSAIDAAGVWLQGFSGLEIDGLEVFGDGKGTGMFFGALTGKLSFKNLYVHDMTYYHPTTPTTEYLGGIGFLDMSFFALDGFRVENLYSKTGTDPVRRFQTDGIGVGGNNGSSRFFLINGFIANVGEGIDITGSGGNTNFTIFNVKAEDCGFASFKIANGNNTGIISHCVSTRAGWGAIALVGSSAPVEQPVGNFTIDNCFIFDTGANPEISGGSITYDGIQLGQSSLQPISPFNVIIDNTVISDRKTVKTMDYGIKAYDAVGQGQNVIIGNNVIIQGFKVKDVASRGAINTLGRHMYADVGVSSGFTTGINGAWTDVIMNVVNYDENFLYNSTTGIFTIKYKGNHDFNCILSWIFNATGLRGARILINGSVYATDLRSAITVAGNPSVAAVSISREFEVGDTIKVQYFQSSGGALDFNSVGTFSKLKINMFGG